MDWCNTVSGWVQYENWSPWGWPWFLLPWWYGSSKKKCRMTACSWTSTSLNTRHWTKNQETNLQPNNNLPNLFFQCCMVVFIPHSYFEKKGPPTRSLSRCQAHTHADSGKGLGSHKGEVSCKIVSLTARPLPWADGELKIKHLSGRHSFGFNVVNPPTKKNNTNKTMNEWTSSMVGHLRLQTHSRLHLSNSGWTLNIQWGWNAPLTVDWWSLVLAGVYGGWIYIYIFIYLSICLCI